MNSVMVSEKLQYSGCPARVLEWLRFDTFFGLCQSLMEFYATFNLVFLNFFMFSAQCPFNLSLPSLAVARNVQLVFRFNLIMDF